MIHRFEREKEEDEEAPLACLCMNARLFLRLSRFLLLLRFFSSFLIAEKQQ